MSYRLIRLVVAVAIAVMSLGSSLLIGWTDSAPGSDGYFLAVPSPGE